MITKRTIERIAKLYFEYDIDIYRIARESNNITIGNITHCLKEMEWKYWPIIINQKYHPATYPDRNKELCALFESGYKTSELVSKFKISKCRVREILHKSKRGCLIHYKKDTDRLIINEENIIDEPDLCEKLIQNIFLDFEEYGYGYICRNYSTIPKKTINKIIKNKGVLV